MLREPPAQQRSPKAVQLKGDLVVVGAGMAGLCCAITAARAGLKVVLIHDRPVPGGNASSEIRLWILGATCHGSAAHRWAREGGVIDEIMVENMYRNLEGNPIILDTILHEWLVRETNLTLLLNTAAFEIIKLEQSPDRIDGVRAFCSQNSTMYECRAPLFCDSSGDGIVGFLAGAAFRMGAEARDEFDEQFAPTGEFGHLLGHSIYFYSKDTGRPVRFTAPSFALKNVPERIPRFRAFNAREHGCRLWWIEWGGRLDTVHETETIKWELWKVVYGVWDYIKNSGKFPDSDNLTLEWVGMIPGKRESRRFEGAYMLRQQDVMQRRLHDDAVSFGGWSIDLHPADGVFSDLAGSHHLNARGVYQIPYRCYYSHNITNLFFAGRIISATHVAFGSIRVMATGAHGGQAVGMAAALCRRSGCLPADLCEPGQIKLLQRELLRIGQHIPNKALEDPDELVRRGSVSASSELRLGALPANGPLHRLEWSAAQMVPVPPGGVPAMALMVDVDADTELRVELRSTSRDDHQSPDVILAARAIALNVGRDIPLYLEFDVPSADRHRYLFYCLMKNPRVQVRCTESRITGLLVIAHKRDEKTGHVGGDEYEVWWPQRRPAGHLFAFTLEPAIAPFAPANAANGIARPTNQSNAWVAALDDSMPSLNVNWVEAQHIARIELFFDPDYDHPMESVLMGQPERAVPFCVKRYRIRDAAGIILHECHENHQARNTIHLREPVTTTGFSVEVLETNAPCSPAAIFECRCYGVNDKTRQIM